MKLFYLVSAIIVGVFILIISFAQLGASCSWYLFSTNTLPTLVLLQVAALGAVMGGLLILFWKAPRSQDENDEDMDTE